MTDHPLDMVGVVSSILAAPTNKQELAKPDEKSGQQVASDLQPGDRVTYFRSGDFGLPSTRHPAVYLRTTKKGMCEIRLDRSNSGRVRYVRRTSIVKATP